VDFEVLRARFFEALDREDGSITFELCDALLCTDGPVRTLVGLALAPEHRRGHGALYGGLNQGRIDVARLRSSEAADRWTWLVIAGYTQLRLARPLVTDLRRPWEKPTDPDQRTHRMGWTPDRP